jgi:hypothetical protein
MGETPVAASPSRTQTAAANQQQSGYNRQTTAPVTQPETLSQRFANVFKNAAGYGLVAVAASGGVLLAPVAVAAVAVIAAYKAIQALEAVMKLFKRDNKPQGQQQAPSGQQQQQQPARQQTGQQQHGFNWNATNLSDSNLGLGFRNPHTLPDPNLPFSYSDMQHLYGYPSAMDEMVSEENVFARLTHYPKKWAPVLNNFHNPNRNIVVNAFAQLSPEHRSIVLDSMKNEHSRLFSQQVLEEFQDVDTKASVQKAQQQGQQTQAQPAAQATAQASAQGEQQPTNQQLAIPGLESTSNANGASTGIQFTQDVDLGIMKAPALGFNMDTVNQALAAARGGR